MTVDYEVIGKTETKWYKNKNTALKQAYKEAKKMPTHNVYVFKCTYGPYKEIPGKSGLIKRDNVYIVRYFRDVKKVVAFNELNKRDKKYKDNYNKWANILKADGTLGQPYYSFLVSKSGDDPKRK